MNIILHGKPGCGKGTQSDNLCEKLNIVAISTGDLFRALDKNSELGQEVSAYTSNGKLVPDEIVMKIIGERLQEPDCSNGVLFDGFPRTENQAIHLKNWLSERGQTLNAVFSLDVTDEESMVRCTMRVTCKNKACKKNFHLKYNLPPISRLYLNESDKG